MVKSKAGKWSMQLKDGVLTMKSVVKEKGLSKTTTIKGKFSFDDFHHTPTANIIAELAYYWVQNFKPCQTTTGEWYNPFTDEFDAGAQEMHYEAKLGDEYRPQDHDSIGKALLEIYEGLDRK